MSGEIVNLRRVRKDKAHAERKRQADANSLKFGRSKAARAQEAGNGAAAGRRLDGHRRDRNEPEPDGGAS